MPNEEQAEVEQLCMKAGGEYVAARSDLMMFKQPAYERSFVFCLMMTVMVFAILRSI
jgi:hypothetical protein